HLLQKGLEMNFLPQAESLSGQAEFPQPGAKIEGHAEPDAGNARTLGRIEQFDQRGDVARDHVAGLFRRRQDHVMGAAADDAAREVDQNRLDRGTVEPDAYAKRAAGSKAQHGRGLAAAAIVTLADRLDQTLGLKILDDATDRRVG